MLLQELGVSKKVLGKLKKKEIYTAEDMLHFYPTAYRDYTNIRHMSEAEVCHGQRAAFVGRAKIPRVINNKHTMCQFYDGTGIVTVFWFNQPWMAKKLGSGINYTIGGTVKWDSEYKSATIQALDLFQKVNDQQTGIILPVYPSIKGISDEMIRNLIRQSFDYVYACPDMIGTTSRKNLGIPNTAVSLQYTHFPKSMDEVALAKKRHMTDTLLPYIRELELKKTDSSSASPFKIKTASILNGILKNLPFVLTPDQMKALRELVADLESGNRVDALVQGDVGCGKTIIAVLLTAVLYQNHYQSVVMAPTAVLASQHYKEFSTTLKDTGASIVYLYGGMKAAEKRNTLKKIASGEADIIIGTHAVFSKDVVFKKLGLTIIDEEHRFGVKQRSLLREKAAEGVHSVSMSATPIPRSVAVAVYGESTKIYNIHSMPNGRKPVKTIVYSNEEKVYQSMLSQINQGHQCYTICPLIEDNDTMQNVDSIETTFKKMTDWFEDYHITVAAISGNMKEAEIRQTLDAFSRGDIKILISTTIVEVGVNVPNATVILIKNAERFGLAQLHQLRGRVGRSALQSYCVLLSDDTENDRLKVMTETTDGFVVAQKDMELRGTGQILGTKQSGTDECLELILSHQDMYQIIKKEVERLLKQSRQS